MHEGGTKWDIRFKPVWSVSHPAFHPWQPTMCAIADPIHGCLQKDGGRSRHNSARSRLPSISITGLRSIRTAMCTLAGRAAGKKKKKDSEWKCRNETARYKETLRFCSLDLRDEFALPSSNKRSQIVRNNLKNCSLNLNFADRWFLIIAKCPQFFYTFSAYEKIYRTYLKSQKIANRSCVYYNVECLLLLSKFKSELVIKIFFRYTSTIHLAPDEAGVEFGRDLNMTTPQQHFLLLKFIYNVSAIRNYSSK